MIRSISLSMALLGLLTQTAVAAAPGKPAQAKAAEAKIAIEQGAREIDTVVPLGRVLSGDWPGVHSDLMAVRAATSGVTLKVIFETCLLEKEHIVRLCEMCTDVGVDFVKTSTGFSTGGATLADVALMRQHNILSFHDRAHFNGITTNPFSGLGTQAESGGNASLYRRQGN